MNERKIVGQVVLLGGWLLLTPPLDERNILAGLHAPLSEWRQLSAHDTAQSCEQARLAIQHRLMNEPAMPKELERAIDEGRTPNELTVRRWQGETLEGYAKCVPAEAAYPAKR